MPRIRSRAKTEDKFINAVLELVAHEGCGALGINAVAHQAGADKVLIYRYFRNLDGLLTRTADSRQWLPSLDELCQELELDLGSSAASAVHQVTRLITHHIRADKATNQVLRWSSSVSNPLTEHFLQEWDNLWQTLADYLSTGLDYDAREAWKHIAELTALSIEAELCDNPVSAGCIDLICKNHAIGHLPERRTEAGPSVDDPLPTNLL